MCKILLDHSIPVSPLIRYGSKNLYILVSGVARRLLSEETRREAFASMQQLADIVGPKQFHSYIDKASNDWELGTFTRPSAFSVLNS